MDFFNGDKQKLQKPANTFGTKAESKVEYDNVKFCQLLGQKALPSLGIYGKYLQSQTSKQILTCDILGFEYQWLYLTGAFRREFSGIDDLKTIRQALP